MRQSDQQASHPNKVGRQDCVKCEWVLGSSKSGQRKKKKEVKDKERMRGLGHIEKEKRSEWVKFLPPANNKTSGGFAASQSEVRAAGSGLSETNKKKGGEPKETHT